MRLSLSLPSDARILVGFSGGADSTALLHLLVRQFGSRQIVSLHIHHGIRGREADEDAAFAASCAEKLGVAHYQENISAPALAREKKQSLETVSREARYALYLSYARKTGCRYVALAHHRNDLVETFLFNLARGSSAGHASVPFSRKLEEITVIRPLLAYSRKEIEDFLVSESLSYRVDSTNLSEDVSRNIIRHRVIPVLERINPGALSHIALSADRMREDEIFLTSLAQSFMDAHLCDGCLETGDLFLQPPPIRRRVLRLFLDRPGLGFSASLPERIAALFSPGSSPSGVLDLGGGWCAERRYSLLCIRKKNEDQISFLPFSVSLEQKGLYPLTDSCYLSLSFIPTPDRSCRLPGALYLEPLSGHALVRPRQTGDEMQFTYGKKTLKRLFIDRKIPNAIRETIPVIEINGRIAAVPFVGCADAFQVKGKQSLCFQLINK